LLLLKEKIPDNMKKESKMANSISTDTINFHHTVSNAATDSFALHCHPYFEVYYFVKGRVSYLVEGKRYEPTPHSILLLAPGTFHGVRVESDDDYERYALHFYPSILSESRTRLLLSPFSGENARRDIYFEGADTFWMEHYLQSLMECANLEDPLRQELIGIRIEALLSQILRMDRLGEASDAAVQNRMITQIVSYLNRNLGESITLDSLSEKFFLSKNHLNFVFKQATGTTIKNYLIHKRVTAAHELILQGYPAATASELCGFRDYSAFFKSYKKILGASPTDAVRQHAGN